MVFNIINIKIKIMIRVSQKWFLLSAVASCGYTFGILVGPWVHWTNLNERQNKKIEKAVGRRKESSHLSLFIIIFVTFLGRPREALKRGEREVCAQLAISTGGREDCGVGW